MCVACCTQRQIRNAWKLRLDKLMGMDHAQKQAPNITGGGKTAPALYSDAHASRRKFGLASLTFSVFFSVLEGMMSLITPWGLPSRSFPLHYHPHHLILRQHGKSLKEINRVKKTILYRRCLVRIYFVNVNSVQWIKPGEKRNK